MKTVKAASLLKKTVLAMSLSGAALMALAANGYTVTPKQAVTIKPGMTSAEVRALIGRPAHSLKFRKDPGRTWIYDVNEANIPNTHTVFYVDFGADNKVVATSERLETDDMEF